MAAGWLVEDGIGERRAALIEGGRLVELAVEWDDDPGPRAGAVLAARLVRGADATGRGAAALADGTLVQLAPVPAGLTEGAGLAVEILREAIPEGAMVKPARARPAPPGLPAAPGPDLLARLARAGAPVRRPDRGESLEALGWGEALEEAASGLVTRPDVLLRITPTPAMTLIDVDGTLAASALAVAGARAAGEAIRRFGLAGSIGIDLPTLGPKAERQAAADALDRALPSPFERTAVNGFGFLQVVRRRERASLVERLAADPAGAAARALLRQGERTPGAGTLTLAAHPAVAARIAARPDWIAALERRVGAAIALRAEGGLAISGGHAARASP